MKKQEDRLLSSYYAKEMQFWTIRKPNLEKWQSCWVDRFLLKEKSWRTCRRGAPLRREKSIPHRTPSTLGNFWINITPTAATTIPFRQILLGPGARDTIIVSQTWQQLWNQERWIFATVQTRIKNHICTGKRNLSQNDPEQTTILFIINWINIFFQVPNLSIQVLPELSSYGNSMSRRLFPIPGLSSFSPELCYSALFAIAIDCPSTT